ncbi:MAG: nucleotidyltransferase domain-containing protein [Elusimicrobia bacterium]|nr:nucleotidyltransferase domain-containing protein [Elusimicrobiota bacterium]
MNKIFTFTSTQKILEFLAKFPGTQFLATEIQDNVKISKGGLNQSLRELSKEGLVHRIKKGKIFLYSVNHSNPIVKQFKILKNIESLLPVTNKLNEISEKIVLFGSSARGEDSFESDIDLFVLTRDPEAVNEAIRKYKLERKVQLIVRTPVVYSGMEKKEPVFFEEIQRGITLWEKKE